MAEPIAEGPTRDSVNKIFRLLPKANSDTNLVKLYLSLVDFYIYNDTDTFSIYVNKALSLSKRLNFKYGEAKALFMLGLSKYSKSDSTYAANQFDQAISICRKAGIIDLEAMIWYKRAESFGNPTNDELRLVYYLEARDLFRKSGNKEKEAYVLKCIADFHFSRGKPLESLKELLEVIKIYQAAGYKKMHYAYDLTGSVYKSMGNYEDALKYAILAVESAQQTKDTSEMTLFYMRFGVIYRELGQYDNAIANFRTALEWCKYKKGTDDFYYSYYSANLVGYIAIIMAKSGNPKEGLGFYLKNIASFLPKGNPFKSLDAKFLGELYMLLKNYPVAERYYLNYFAESSLGGKTTDISVLLGAGNFYVAINQFAKAKVFLQRALNAVSVNSSFQLPQIHQLLFRVDSASGDYISAIRHYQAFKSITDSVFNDKKINQIGSLQMKFETEKKDQDIMLLTAQTKEQQEVLKKQVLLRNVMIAGAAMLLLLLWFIFSRYQVKNKTALQLQSQQEIINNKNNKLEELLTEKEELIAAKNELIIEKEWLLKEVHHRVKNNLQMVMTLLYTQSAYLKDQQALDAILESQNRIHAISLIHQKLYQSENLEVINMKGYIHEMVDNLKECFDKNDTIETDLDIEPLELDVSKSIPVGLMLNEAVTNAMKYAFKSIPKKIISVSLRKHEDGENVLIIKDNGTGLPAGFEPLESHTLGLKLIKGLCKQIRANCSIENNPGVCITIRFGHKFHSDEALDNSIFENHQNSIT